MEKVIKLLDYLELDKDVEVKESQYDENIYVVDGEEYLILTDEEADETHREYIKSFIEDCGITGFTEFAQEYIYENCMDSSWFDEAMKESFESYVEDIRNEESDNGFKNRLVEEMYDNGCEDEDSYVEYLCSSYENGIQWYRENFGDTDFASIVNEHCSLDIDKISEFCIEYDGRGHSLSSYDGHELELDDEYYAYRVS